MPVLPGLTRLRSKTDGFSSRFNRVTKDVNEALETYRFHEAANQIYDFFWGEFCDWYIELIKPRLLDEADPQSARVAMRQFAGHFRCCFAIAASVSCRSSPKKSGRQFTMGTRR